MMLDEAAAWKVLDAIPDPEIPVISVCDLGIVREVRADADCIDVVVTPTYSGCPATETIERSIRDGLQAAGARQVNVSKRLSPPWSTDWISARGRERLREYGIVPPGEREPHAANVSTIRMAPRALECPRCGSRQTVRLSQFGSTACKAQYRCDDCLEPFDYFKAH